MSWKDSKLRYTTNKLLIAALTLLFARVERASAQSTVLSDQAKAPMSSYYFPSANVEGKIGQKDSSALAELKLSSEGCFAGKASSIHIDGTVVIGTSSHSPLTATLEVQSGYSSRFDLVTPSGPVSLRSHLTTNVKQAADQKLTETMPQQFPGVFPLAFQILEVAERQQSSVTDDGLVDISGEQYHKVTVSSEAKGVRVASALYFDPVTHVLRELVQDVPGNGRSRRTFTRVVKYDNYRSVGALTLPFTMTEEFDKHLSLQLTANSIVITLAHEPSYFTFN